MSAPQLEIPIGVVVERRPSNNQWIDFSWRPTAILIGAPETLPWTVIAEEKEYTSFFAGRISVKLHISETEQYKNNLASGAPSLWVVLRPGHGVPYELLLVTADPSEGELMTEPGTDLVEAVPMPDAIRDEIEAFVGQHHVERPFFKRRRDRIDPENQGRRGPSIRGGRE